MSFLGYSQIIIGKDGKINALFADPINENNSK